MSKVRFISDLHIGHNKIAEFSGPFRGGVTNVDEHDKWIVDQWNSVVSKQDVVIVLGDVCFDQSRFETFKRMKGNKHLLLGNHDRFTANKYLPYFNKIIGYQKYKNLAWLSHAPIHPGSLRNFFNIHGHTHEKSLPDLRYISVCVEVLNGKPILWDDLVNMMLERKSQ